MSGEDKLTRIAIVSADKCKPCVLLRRGSSKKKKKNARQGARVLTSIAIVRAQVQMSRCV